VKRFMLDTHTVSHLMCGNAQVARRVRQQAVNTLCMSAVTEGELLFGVARRPQARRLHLAVRELRARVAGVPWTSTAAEHYGPLRAELSARGTLFDTLDLLIAAHALAEGTVLVSSDRAFARVPGLRVEDWTA
jgi:tRNA(fMet)-specific endonuclease VapC